jgi:hypothetical protein
VLEVAIAAVSVVVSIIDDDDYNSNKMGRIIRLLFYTDTGGRKRTLVSMRNEVNKSTQF